MKNNSRKSLKFKIMSLSLGMMVVMAVITFIMVQVLNGKQKELAEGNMSSYAQGLAAAVATQFKQRYGDIQAFASNSTMLLSDKQAVTDVLNTYVKLYGIYDTIALFDIEGDLVAANDVTHDGKKLDLKKLESTNQKASAWFVETLNLRYSNEPEKGLTGTFVEDFQLDPIPTMVYGEKRYGNSFTTAIRNMEGKVTGVLTARANFRYVEKEFQNYYNTIKSNGIASVELTMLNGKGQVIVDYDPFYNKGNLDINHNPDVLLTLNLAEKNVEAAKDLVAGKSGHITSLHARKGFDQFTGYTSLKTNPQFLSTIAWGVMVRAEEHAVLGGVYASVRPFYVIAVIAFIVSAIFGFWWTNAMSSQLVAVSGRLRLGADDTSNTSDELQNCAKELAVCSNEQAAAVQETVAAMEEMNSMINQSGEYIAESLQSAKRVSDKTEEGAQIMRQMVDAMESIQEANSQLQNMANIINEISAKTNVINDIVFKTQLLSFNASIEAARAGQHGRGFAVVAEEVGNLAQMSGAAAKEIKSLLDDSQKQVLQIVEITRARSTDGQEVSKKAQKTFDEIAQEIKTITSQIESVNDAAREQENGVQQTSVAMNKLDEATTRSARMGEQVSVSADNLSDQSKRMNQIMRATMMLVQGTAESAEAGDKRGDIVDELISGPRKKEVTPRDLEGEKEVEQILSETAAHGAAVAKEDLRKLGSFKGKTNKIISIAGKLVEKVKDVEKKIVHTAKGKVRPSGNANPKPDADDDIDADDSSFKKTV